MFFLLYKRADDAVFDDIPKISDNFPKISEDFRKFPKIVPKARRTFPDIFQTFLKIFRRLPKIAEECRRRPKRIRGCFDHTLTNFSVAGGTKEKCYQI